MHEGVRLHMTEVCMFVPLHACYQICLFFGGCDAVFQHSYSVDTACMVCDCAWVRFMTDGRPPVKA